MLQLPESPIACAKRDEAHGNLSQALFSSLGSLSLSPPTSPALGRQAREG